MLWQKELPGANLVLRGARVLDPVEGIDARDRLRFWRAYMGPERRTFPGQVLRYFVLMRGRRYRNHNRKAAAKKSGTEN